MDLTYDNYGYALTIEHRYVCGIDITVILIQSLTFRYTLWQTFTYLWFESPFHSWENSLFLWPCSSSQTVELTISYRYVYGIDIQL